VPIRIRARLQLSKSWMQVSYYLVLDNVDTPLEWVLKRNYVTYKNQSPCKKVRTRSIFLQGFGCQDTDNTGLTQNMCPEVVKVFYYYFLTFLLLIQCSWSVNFSKCIQYLGQRNRSIHWWLIHRREKKISFSSSQNGF
jgi:hypothetical protein